MVFGLFIILDIKKRNTFYFIDITKPTRLDMEMESDPEVFALKKLPPAIQPDMINKELNDGSYHCVKRHLVGSVYFYKFPKTEKASSAN